MSELWRQSLDLHGRPARPVTWTCAAPRRDLPALRRWRCAVGPVRVADAAPDSLPPDHAARRSLTVAVWNANVGGGAIQAFWDRVARGRDGAVGPTVALLQEVFETAPGIPSPTAVAASPAPASAPTTPAAPPTPGSVPTPASSGPTPAWSWAERIAPAPSGEPRTDIASFARKAGLSLVYVPSMRNGDPAHDPPEDRGNAIVANIPLSSPRAVELPFERQRRVAVMANVTLAGATIALCSVHLDNRAPWRRAWRTLGAARRRQMSGLLDVFPEDAAADAHVLGGDLNTWVGGRREGAYRLARARFPLPTRPDVRPTHHFEIGGWLRHSDHLMFRLPPGWHGEYRRLDDTFGSDHYPLTGTAKP